VRGGGSRCSSTAAPGVGGLALLFGAVVAAWRRRDQ